MAYYGHDQYRRRRQLFYENKYANNSVDDGYSTEARSEAGDQKEPVGPKSVAEALMDKFVKLLHSDIGKAFVTGTLMLVGSRTKFSVATALISGICQAVLIFEYTGLIKLTRSTSRILKTVALLVMLVRMALQQDFVGRLANFTALCCALSWS